MLGENSEVPGEEDIFPWQETGQRMPEDELP